MVDFRLFPHIQTCSGTDAVWASSHTTVSPWLDAMPAISGWTLDMPPETSRKRHLKLVWNATGCGSGKTGK